MIGPHKLCDHGCCTGTPPYGCGTKCALCVATKTREDADAICGFPEKNSKKTVRQVMRELEEGTTTLQDASADLRWICSGCGEPITYAQQYVSFGGSFRPFVMPKVYHMCCVPTIPDPTKPELNEVAYLGVRLVNRNDALDARLAKGERGVPKIPDAPDTRHAITERVPAPTSVMTYGHVKTLIESHRELLTTLKAVMTQMSATVDIHKHVNMDFISKVITRGENATK